MSILISYKNGSTGLFNRDVCVFKQLHNAAAVDLDLSDLDEVDFFLTSLMDSCPLVILPPIDIRVDHKNTVAGARIAKNTKSIRQQMIVNWAIKEIVKYQSNLDSKLSDIITQMREISINA